MPRQARGAGPDTGRRPGPPGTHDQRTRGGRFGVVSPTRAGPARRAAGAALRPLPVPDSGTRCPGSRSSESSMSTTPRPGRTGSGWARCRRPASPQRRRARRTVPAVRRPGLGGPQPGSRGSRRTSPRRSAIPRTCPGRWPCGGGTTGCCAAGRAAAGYAPPDGRDTNGTAPGLPRRAGPAVPRPPGTQLCRCPPHGRLPVLGDLRTVRGGDACRGVSDHAPPGTRRCGRSRGRSRGRGRRRPGAR